jgi:hypothetical protein
MPESTDRPTPFYWVLRLVGVSPGPKLEKPPGTIVRLKPWCATRREATTDRPEPSHSSAAGTVRPAVSVVDLEGFEWSGATCGNSLAPGCHPQHESPRCGLPIAEQLVLGNHRSRPGDGEVKLDFTSKQHIGAQLVDVADTLVVEGVRADRLPADVDQPRLLQLADPFDPGVLRDPIPKVSDRWAEPHPGLVGTRALVEQHDQHGHRRPGEDAHPTAGP